MKVEHSKDPSPVTDGDTCTTREAALRLGASLRAVQLWVESGVLDAWKTPGGHRRIAVESVERVLANRRAAATARIPTPPRDLTKVLVVEDDKPLLKLYEMTLAGWTPPVDLRIAENGYEGLILLGQARPDVLITDLMMPGIDGFRMLAALRKQTALADLRIVVVTGLSPAAIAERGGLPRGITVLPKPIPFDELERIVRDFDRPHKEKAI